MERANKTQGGVNMKNNKSLELYTRQCYKCGVVFKTKSKSYGKRV